MKLMQLGVFAAAVAMAGATQAQSALTPGSVLRGQLSRTDARLDDGSFYDCHTLQTRSGQGYRVEMLSEAFDAYMVLGSGAGCVWSNGQSDDDGAGGTNSRVDFTGDGRVWSVRANSLSAGETGAYTLTFAQLGGASAAEQGGALAPRVTPPIAFGETVHGALVSGDLMAEDDSFYDCFTFSGRAGQQAVVEMRSGEFDTYLALHSGGYCAGGTLATDDDGAGGTNSRLEFNLPRDGVYTIRANSLGAGQIGRYGLSLIGGGGSNAPAPAAPSRFAGQREIVACVYEQGSHALREMRGKADATDSVLIVGGREVSLADAGATQAQGRPWYTNGESVRVEGREYVKYGLPRVLSFWEVEFFSEYDGVAFAAEGGLGGLAEVGLAVPAPEVVYALVRSVGCEFQPYQLQN